MNRDDVIDVLSVVAAATRRTIGETDVDVWQAVIGELPKDLSLAAVRDHLRECPGVWLEPGHVFGRVRARLRDQLEREPDRDREARQAELDSRFAEQLAELAAAKSMPAAEKFKRPDVSPLIVDCPWCRAAAGHHCVVPRTTERRPAGRAHPARIEAAAVARGQS